MAKTLIVAGRVKELAKHPVSGQPLNVSSELVEVLTAVTEKIIKKACKRAVENGRSTVMARDL